MREKLGNLVDLALLLVDRLEEADLPYALGGALLRSDSDDLDMELPATSQARLIGSRPL